MSVSARPARTPAEGTDTVLWLAASQRGRERSGDLCFGREPRRRLLVPGTCEAATERRVQWALCQAFTRGRDETSQADTRLQRAR